MYILAVDSDPTLCKAIKFILQGDDHEVATACSVKDALMLSARRQPDILIMDVALEGMAGSSIDQLLRRDSLGPVVLILVPQSAAAQLTNLPGLTFGEYLVKPFHPEELTAAVKRLTDLWGKSLRIPMRSDRIAVGSLELRPSRSRMVIHDGNITRIVSLAPFEVELAGCLMAWAGSEVPLERLVRSLRPHADPRETGAAVEMCARDLQSKIEEDGEHPRYLQIVNGRAYRFKLPDEIAN